MSRAAAIALLNAVRDGFDAPEADITAALTITGDLERGSWLTSIPAGVGGVDSRVGVVAHASPPIDCDDWIADMVPSQLTVPASQCAPVRGINSVFAFAEAA